MQVKPFLDLMKRAQKSRYTEFVMSNRMIMQCYDVSQDSDAGTHYMLHIPDTEEYKDKFYNQSIIIVPENVLYVYKTGHDELLEAKKKKGAKPRDCKEFIDIVYFDDMVELTFQHIIYDELIASNDIGFRYATDNHPNVQLITKTLTDLENRIKVNGLAAVVDGYKSGFYFKAMNHEQIAYGKIKLGDRKVRVPLFKSMLAGIKEPEDIKLSIQETNLKDIYVYTVQLTNKGLVDQYISYILNF